MKIFVTGMNGQLGMDVYTEVKSRGYEITGCGRSVKPEKELTGYIALDLADRQDIHNIIVGENPDVIIHCAAWTNVDVAEKIENKNNVFYSNVVATQEVLQAAMKSNAKLIYISTDYVFNNTNGSAVDWCHKAAPINYYGYTKWLGEEIVKTYDKSFIVRTSWVYGEHGNNFVKTILNLIEKYPECNVVNDQFGRPTYTADLAKLLIDMAESEKYGIYHATNEGNYISWYDFACEIAGSKSNKIKPVSTEEYYKNKTGYANRPKYSMLSTNNLKACGFKQLPDWKESLEKFKNNYTKHNEKRE